MLEDWRQMISNEKEFGDDHFLHFLGEDYSEGVIDEIFSSLNNTDKLKKRYWTFKENYHLRDLSKVTISDERLLELVKFDLEEKNKVLKNLGLSYLDPLIADLKFKFIDEDEFNHLLLDSLLNVDVLSEIEYYLSDKFIRQGIKVHHIYRAFLGIGNYFKYVAWYLAKPLYNADFNPDLHFEILRHACDYQIGKNVVYVLNRNKVLN